MVTRTTDRAISIAIVDCEDNVPSASLANIRLRLEEEAMHSWWLKFPFSALRYESRRKVSLHRINFMPKAMYIGRRCRLNTIK